MSDIAERVKKIVVEHLGVEPEKVTENASFIDDLGADSLDTVELVMAFEEEFGCEIPDDAAETILTVDNPGGACADFSCGQEPGIIAGFPCGPPVWNKSPRGAFAWRLGRTVLRPGCHARKGRT